MANCCEGEGGPLHTLRDVDTNGAGIFGDYAVGQEDCVRVGELEGQLGPQLESYKTCSRKNTVQGEEHASLVSTTQSPLS